MRVLLAVPPTPSTLKRILGTGAPPLGISYLAAYIREAGHEVKLIDGFEEGLSRNELIERIKRFSPDVVGISTLTANLYRGYQMAKVIKEVNDKIKILMGGPHVSFIPEESLKECPYVDVIVRGEGEITLLELLQELEKKEPNLKNVKGITWREKNGKIISNPPRAPIEDLDTLPFPAYDLLPMDRYKVNKKIITGTMITSRGCPFGCIFCSSSKLMGKRWRGRSPENVVEEMELLVKKYGVNEIEFLDDTFTFDKERAIKIANLIRRRDLEIAWGCSSRVDTLDDELARELKKGGCYRIYMGIESGSQKTLRLINKGITTEKAERAVSIAKAHGLEVIGSFIIGVPGETKEDILSTIRFAKKLGIDYAQFTLLTPYPGTPIYRYALENNLLLTKNWSLYGMLDPVMKVPGFTSKDLIKFIKRAYISFYINPAFFWKEIKKGRLFFLRRAINGFLRVRWTPNLEEGWEKEEIIAQG
ncbi:MAG: radical SAM protein [Synergistetes bacterium]|nr:radical SAM protein [Synergistota bacterium]